MPGRQGYSGYALALGCLPATTAGIAKAAKLEPKSVPQMMRQFWHLGLCHPGGTAGSPRNPAVLWMPGDGPKNTTAKCGAKKRPYLQHITYAYAIRALETGATTHEVAEAIGTSLETAQRLVRIMRQHKLLRICEWRRGTDYKPVAVYEYGKGADAPKPVQTPAEKSRRQRVALRNAVIALHPRSEWDWELVGKNWEAGKQP